MSEPIQHVPLAEIDDAALARDRTGLDPEPLRELRDSILKSGLRLPRLPVELFPLAEPSGDHRYGIVSGFRRVAAYRELHGWGMERYASIPAFVRAPRELAETLAAMVEENAVRADVSPYEQGRVAWFGRNAGVFPTIEEAVERLYPTANAMKRSRLRALASLPEELDGLLTAPEKLSLRQALRIAGAIREGFGEVMATALQQSSLNDPETQWQILQPYLVEAERQQQAAEDVEPTPALVSEGRRRPFRTSRPRPGIVIRREMTRDGWCLHFTGKEAKSALMDRVIEEIADIFSPRWATSRPERAPR
jgi:ParB family chromosome partitioning protein